MPCKAVNNHSDMDYNKYKPLFDDFFPYSQKRLGYTNPFSVNLMSDEEISIYVSGRHIKDVLRSVAHEIVHHLQNERGDFDRPMQTGPGYAQEDGHLRGMEEEAYREGNMMFRDWEDGYKAGKRCGNHKIKIKIRKK